MNKTKSELKVYLDHLVGLVPEDFQGIARELRKDVYEIFKDLKKPETVVVRQVVKEDDKPLRAEIENLKAENGNLRFRLSKCEDKEMAFHRANLASIGAFAGGYVVGRSQQCGEGNPSHADMEEFQSAALSSIVIFTDADKQGLVAKDLYRVCLSMVTYMAAWNDEDETKVEPLAAELFRAYYDALQKGQQPKAVGASVV